MVSNSYSQSRWFFFKASFLEKEGQEQRLLSWTTQRVMRESQVTSRNVDQTRGKRPGVFFPILDPRKFAVVPKFIYGSSS